MVTSFADMERVLAERGARFTIGLAGSNDSYGIKALAMAARKGFVRPVLLGDERETLAAIAEAEESPEDFELVSCASDEECAAKAIEFVHSGRIDMPMKGLLQTSTFMRAILDKMTGILAPGALLSQSTLVERQDGNGFFQVTDCAINIAPDTVAKRAIIENAVRLAHAIGCACPRVAVVSAVEKVNPKIPSTVQAQELTELCRRGEITGCIVEGPLALDNAISQEAARHKKIGGEVAGRADILVMPDLCAGNILTKSMTFYAHMVSAGCLLGTRSPVVASSRTDTPENKYNSILATLMSALDR